MSTHGTPGGDPDPRRRSRAGGALVALALALVWIGGAAAQTGEVAGMITEIRLGQGTVEVRTVGAAEWRPAAPLMSLLGGDTVRASNGASAVVLLTAGRGVLRVESGAEPAVVPAPQAAESTMRKAGALLAGSFGFLTSHARELRQTVIGVRSLVLSPVVLGPRQGVALADPLRLEWVGAGSTRYTVQVLGPDRRLLVQQEVEGTRWEYPPDAPRLVPGIRYVARVTGPGSQPPEEAWFEVAGPERTREVRAALGVLEAELGGRAPGGTLAVAQAGYLAGQGLHDEARRVLLAALARDPHEPTLHLVLGNVYTKVGLPRQANQAFDTAEDLMRRRR